MAKSVGNRALLAVEPPEEIVLGGPFDKAVCKKIIVFNPSPDTRVAFKMKTTTPRLFFVRPNVAVVKPQESISINIFVHPIHRDLGVLRHKFLIQATELHEDVLDLHEFWKSVSPELIWDTKIKIKLLENGNDETFKLSGVKNSESLAKLVQRMNEFRKAGRQTVVRQVESLSKESEEKILSSKQPQKEQISSKQPQKEQISSKPKQKKVQHGFFYYMVIFLLIIIFVGASVYANYITNFM